MPATADTRPQRERIIHAAQSYAANLKWMTIPLYMANGKPWEQTIKGMRRPANFRPTVVAEDIPGLFLADSS